MLERKEGGASNIEHPNKRLGVDVALEIEIFGMLFPDVPRRQAVTLDHPMTVGQVIAMLGLDPDAVGLIVINGVQAELEDQVPVTGRLCFFPPVSGG